MIKITDIPLEVKQVADTLEGAGFEAYLVGGCVRDLIIGRTPKDWDLTTDARPDASKPFFRRVFVIMTTGLWV